MITCPDCTAELGLRGPPTDADWSAYADHKLHVCPSNGPPEPRESGPAPRQPAAVHCLQAATVQALLEQVRTQDAREPLHAGSKVRRLANLCSDLEMAIVVNAPPDVRARLCLEVAAFALRIREQGD